MRHVAEDFYRSCKSDPQPRWRSYPRRGLLNYGEQCACQAEFKWLLLQILCGCSQTNLHQSCTWINILSFWYNDHVENPHGLIRPGRSSWRNNTEPWPKSDAVNIYLSGRLTALFNLIYLSFLCNTSAWSLKKTCSPYIALPICYTDQEQNPQESWDVELQSQHHSSDFGLRHMRGIGCLFANRPKFHNLICKSSNVLNIWFEVP
jgi:hypothetical protein